MYRIANDFKQDWTKPSTGMLDVLRAMTDDTLGQKIVPGVMGPTKEQTHR